MMYIDYYVWSSSLTIGCLVVKRKLIEIKSMSGSSIKAEECFCEWWRKVSQCVVLDEEVHCRIYGA